MIFATCLFCDEPYSVPFADYGLLEKITCARCGKEQWLEHSRLDPISYPPEMIEVNEDLRTVKISRQE